MRINQSDELFEHFAKIPTSVISGKSRKYMKYLVLPVLAACITLAAPEKISRQKICFSDPFWTLGEVGRASWYGDPFHGRVTANGEIYNMYELTAAHRALPFGTQIRVTNIRNARSVVLRVNDRGPYISGRFLDVSYGAATALNFVGSGVVPVKAEVVRFPEKYDGDWPAPDELSYPTLPQVSAELTP